MGPNDTPEGNPRNAQNQEQIGYQQFLNDFAAALTEKIRAIEADPNKSREQKDQERANLSSKQLNELREKLTALEIIKESQRGKTMTEAAREQEKEAKNEIRDALSKTIIATEKHLELTKDKKAQTILNELTNTRLNMEEVGEIAEKLGPYITGAKDILLTERGERSDFEKTVDSFKSEDPVLYEKIIEGIKRRPENFGITGDLANEKFPSEARKQTGNQENTADRQRLEREMYSDDLYSRFSPDQQTFLQCLESPEKFKDHVIEKITDPKAAEKKVKFKENIKEIYQEQKRPIPDEQELNQLVERKWLQNVTADITDELGLVMNQLLLRLQREGGNKFYDELANEDFMRGITTTQNRIRNALQKLQQTLVEIKNDPKYSDQEKKEYEKIKLYKFFDAGHYTDEKEEGKKTVPYYKLYPLLKPKEISLSDFALQLTIQLDHMSEQRNYLHDGRVIHKQPPGKDGFYSQLGGYAERYSGTDVDEMMLLPDGDLALEAFQLYEKYLEEDLASLDWRTRPTEYTEQLGDVFTQLELEIIEQMKLEYGSNFDVERIKAAVNKGVGMARAVFLTEPEKSSYTDPVNPDGSGMIGSYGTNDAGSLNALNPLHVELRWQGEHHMFRYYFNSIHGQKGMMWDHNKMADNQGNYKKSFIEGNEKLPEDLFIDKMIGVTKAGGIFTREGWRPELALAGHFRYIVDKDGKKTVDAIETFRAMDYIGYEAIKDFFSNMRMGQDILKNTELAGERKKFFQYIFEHYFKEFDGADFDSYMAEVRKAGEEKALKVIKGEDKDRMKDKGTTPAGSWEKQVELETSQIFLKRALMREIALRFPSKFLRIDRSRFEKDGVSRWQKIQKELGMSRDEFNTAMKDFVFTERLLRKEASKRIKDQLYFDPTSTIDLNKVKIDYGFLNEKTIEELLLNKTEGKDKDGNLLMTPERIEKVQKIYRAIRENFLNGKFLNGEAIDAVEKYPFSFGVEDTDLSLMAFRGTGPRMIARSIKDTGILEQGAVPAITDLGRTLQQMAINGKQDFSPIIEAMLKARKAFNDVHGTGNDYEFQYTLATAVIQYFKKDSIAKPLFGLFGMGRINSSAGLYAGRSTAVWEWDSRDIDRFITSLESYRLLPKKAYEIWNVNKKGAERVDAYGINPFTKKPFKLPWKVNRVDFEYNAARLRKEFGGRYRDMAFDIINNLLPLALIFVFWQFLKKALEETEGKKR